MMLLPAARAEGLSKGAGAPAVVGSLIALAIGMLVLFAILPVKLAFIAVFISAPLAGLVVMWAYRRLGGQTGDVLGAIQQVIEMSVIIAAAGWSLTF